MAFMLAYLKVPLSWGEIARRTVRESINDNCLGMAAQLAYYFFFGLFPALLFFIAIASYFPLETLIDDMFAMLGGIAPPEVLSIITDQIRKISEGEQGGLLTPNKLDQPKLQTTTTRFNLFAVPGESYEVTFYRGDKSEKHTVTVSTE